MNIKLFSSNISYSGDAIITNMDLNDTKNLLRMAYFREIDSITPIDNIHGTFVIEEKYALKTPPNYIDIFTIVPKITKKRVIRKPTTTTFLPTPTITEEPLNTIALALAPTQAPTTAPTKFNCNSLSNQYECNNTDDCYYIQKNSICKK